MARLRVTEIFHSLQGEGITTGLRTAFIRLTGCPLRCGYCDTAYAFKGGEWLSFDEITRQVARYGVRQITVTGGEPLAQPDCLALLTLLCDQGYKVSLETSGALDIAEVDPRVVKVMDLKTPGSGEQERNLYDNLACLSDRDQLKFVICDRSDYEWATRILHDYALQPGCEILFSPCAGRQDPQALAQWILDDRLDVRLQIQLHKLLWGDQPGR